MKIAITGHSAGIGQALAQVYSDRGHEIVGLSRRNGYNIRSVGKIVSMIDPCDIFINNAQVGFAQTELLFAVYKQWRDQKHKKIINIGTILTNSPTSSLPGIEMIEYYVQKKSLDEAVSQLRQFHNGPKLCLVKPGAVATQPGQSSDRTYADVNEWANTLIHILDVDSSLQVSEISLDVNYE